MTIAFPTPLTDYVERWLESQNVTVWRLASEAGLWLTAFFLVILIVAIIIAAIGSMVD